MEQIPVLQFALGKFILIHYHLMGGRGEGGAGVEEGDQLSLTEKKVSDRESPLTVIFSDSSRIFLVFTHYLLTQCSLAYSDHLFPFYNTQSKCPLYIVRVTNLQLFPQLQNFYFLLASGNLMAPYRRKNTINHLLQQRKKLIWNFNN